MKEKIVVERVEVAGPAGPLVFNQAKAGELALSNKEMTERLFVSENTITTHCSRVFDKLGVGRRTQAVQIGKQLALIP